MTWLEQRNTAMGILDHWHPVIKSSDLRAEPVGIQLAGEDLALFRTRSGKPAALTDSCPHRRMRLSCGWVEGERLRCRYHGWVYTTDGEGESPATPKLHASVTAFDTQEKWGAVWIKSKDSKAAFPSFDVAGFLPICTLQHRAPAPLELVVDNFCEIEHTPTTHALFGYDLQRMPEVTVQFEPTDTTVRVVNTGPPKPMGLFLHTLLGIRKGYQFNDEWTTYFSPVYSVYDHWWSDPETGRQAKVRWRLYIFFTPVDACQTEIMTFAFVRSSWPGPAGGARLFRWLMRKQLDHEIRLDLKILQGLASHNTKLDGLKLSRFDRVLGLNRERIERVYRGTGLNGA
jgi:phenylpropionate dioxygenase-like ring-hydroxylating dioxygenase large terminal subunit